MDFHIVQLCLIKGQVMLKLPLWFLLVQSYTALRLTQPEPVF